MLSFNPKLVSLGFVSLCLFLSAIASEESKIVPLASLPAPVQHTIQTNLMGGHIGEIEQVGSNDEAVFLLTITKGEAERSLKVDGDGTLLSTEIELNDAPPLVRSAIQKLVAGGSIDNIDKSFNEGAITYEIDFTTTNGVDRSFTLATDGKLERYQVFLAELPAVIKKAIEQNSTNATIGDIFRTITDGEVAYDVDITRDGKDRDFVVGADGKLESKEVFLAELPGGARKTITDKIGNGKILRIDESFVKRGGVFPFEVTGRKDGKPFNFSVGPKGRFFGMDE